MFSLRLRNGRTITEGSQPYVTAEINTGHFGNMEMAVKAVHAAREAGCDCIKFQSWKPESLYTNKYLAEHRIERRIYERLSLDPGQLAELTQECNVQGIDFCSTPYSFSEIDDLVALETVPYIKIASMDINNLEFLRYAAETMVPLVLSTGMADMDEIRVAVSVILGAGGGELAVLHCTSLYPTPDSELNLLNIRTLKEEFPGVIVGYSDHSLGLVAPAVAIGLGSVMLEKHFTLDKSKPGFDNAMALDPLELASYVTNAHSAASMLGRSERVVSEAEIAQRQVMRRSVFAAAYLTSGTIITSDLIQVKRPGTGAPPTTVKDLIGKRLARDVAEGEPITLDDV